MLQITQRVSIPEDEIEIRAIRASGPGGQHVNKTSSAVQLFFDISCSSLPEAWKQRLLAQNDSRISDDGVLVIKAQEHRSREKNLEAAYARLRAKVRAAITPPKPRRPTKPTRAAKRKRLNEKAKQSEKKFLRGKVTE